MQPRLRRQTESTNVPCVRRNLRFNENNVKHKSLRNPGKQEKKDRELNSCVPAFFRDLEFAGDEFLQLNHIGGELADPLACFLVRHRVIVQHPAEFLFIQLQLLNVR